MKCSKNANFDHDNFYYGDDFCAIIIDNIDWYYWVLARTIFLSSFCKFVLFY